MSRLMEPRSLPLAVLTRRSIRMVGTASGSKRGSRHEPIDRASLATARGTDQTKHPYGHNKRYETDSPSLPTDGKTNVASLVVASCRVRFRLSESVSLAGR